MRPVPPADPDTLIRDIRRVFAITGLLEARTGRRDGGYMLSARRNGVHVTWWTDDAFSDNAISVAVNQPEHPMARLNRDLVAAMEHAMADVLYAAGFTVALQPGVRAADPEKGSDPEVIVVAGPGFRAWAGG